MPTVDPVISARNRLAGLHVGKNKPDPETVADARRRLTEAKAERAIREAVAAAPPLTDEQRHRLAALLTGPRK